MRALALHVDAAMGIARRDLTVFVSYRMRLVTSQFGILFNLALFYYVSRLVNVPMFSDPDAYYAFVVVGIIILGVARSSLALPSTVRMEMVAGTYERMVLSPFGGTLAVLAMFVFPFLYSVLVAALTLGIASTVFGVDVAWDTAWLAIPVGLLAALSFAPVALLFTAITIAFKQAPGQGVIVALISLVSGLYFPTDLLPAWLRWMGDVQPFTPTVDLMRHVAVGLPLQDPVAMVVAKLVLFAVVGLPVSVWLVRAAGRMSRRRGTITEY